MFIESGHLFSAVIGLFNAISVDYFFMPYLFLDALIHLPKVMIPFQLLH